MRFPRCGRRVLGIHGIGSFHRLHGHPAIARALGYGWVVAQPTRPMPDRVLAGEMPADRDLQTRTGAPPRLPGQLKRAPVEGDGVVTGDDALLLLTEDVLEVHASGTKALAGSCGGHVNVAL